MFHSNVQKLFNKTFTLGVMKNFLSLNTKMFFLQIFARIFNNISLFMSEGQSLGIHISIYRITYLLLKTNPKDVIFFFNAVRYIWCSTKILLFGILPQGLTKSCWIVSKGESLDFAAAGAKLGCGQW